MQNSDVSPQLKKMLPIVYKGMQQKVVHLSTSDYAFDGRSITVDGQSLINFASCSYLGLASDQRLIDNSASYTQRYGTSFPTSRSFVSTGYLEELETTLQQVFGHPCLVASSTSLGHLAFLPSLVQRQDAVVLDHQVHNSVSTASELLKARGCTMDLIRHNDLAALEQKIIHYQEKQQKVWYLADGIYSMYGDKAPIKALVKLLDQYDNFHVYVDDAHGMSWLGERGKGFVLHEAPLHPRMALITSLGKAFGSLGGVLIFKDEASKAFVKQCGSPFIFSSPPPPTVVGASLAAANIHLTDELPQLQAQLLERIRYFKAKAKSLDIALIDNGETPIFFIPAGNPDTCFQISKQLMQQGFYQSSAVFPSVPLNNAGLRFTMTNWIEQKDIDQLLEQVVIQRQKVFQQEQLNVVEVQKKFRGVLFT